MTVKHLFAFSVSGLILVGQATAQVAPDSGQLLQQQNQQVPQLPRAVKGIEIQVPAAAVTLPGGATVTLKAVKFVGNSVFSEESLRAALGEFSATGMDLAGLRGLAGKVTDYYHANGYPFARAFIPAQELNDGVLQIEIVEGRYGKVLAIGDPVIAKSAQGFLYPLQPGSVIEARQLERTTLIIDDLPGVKVTPVIRPGQEFGSGDLDATVSPTEALTGEVGLDNHGNRYTGSYRLRTTVQWDSPLIVGDQFTLRGLYTNEQMWMGSLGYSLPLGKTGLRGNVGYAHTYYQLGNDFANLGATGTADVTSAGLSYPLIRSQISNLVLAGTYQHKRLNDKQDLVGTSYGKSSDSLPIALNFDYRDSLVSGGVTFGALTYTPGTLHLDDALAAQDAASGRDKRGRFNKLNVDVARLQQTPVSNLTFYGRASAQWADKNLDSSEGFLLGGPNGVRAYPVSEGAGDDGWLAQLEMRYALGEVVPFVFYDAGKVRINAKAGNLAVPVTTNTRSLAGGGAGVRYQHGALSIDASVAWRTEGGDAVSDTKAKNPAVWLAFLYRF